MFAAINEAREQVLLATSYFVPPLPLVTALESAALCGGVRAAVSARKIGLCLGDACRPILLRIAVERGRGDLRIRIRTDARQNADHRWNVVARGFAEFRRAACC